MKQPNPQTTGSGGLARWNQLHAKRRGMLSRFEDYASVTIPKVCLPDGVDENTSSIQHDWTSVGAQAVNHVTNKIVMALFQPGLPFFRLDPDDTLIKQWATQGITEEMAREAMVGGEQKALRILDQKAVRPKLHETVRALVVVGNAALDFTDDDNLRVIGIRNYVAKRNLKGQLVETLIHEQVSYDELDDGVQAQFPRRGAGGFRNGAEAETVHFIRWYRKVAGDKWELTQWVDNHKVQGTNFNRTYNAETMPIRVLTWDLADEHNYGTGLVEDYAGDFGTLSTLSESEIKAAILASDYRWLANPAGVGDINEFKKSATGDVIPGVKDDLTLVSHVSGQGLKLISDSADKVVRRIGQAFLLGSAVTRDAERVTAEEIRMQANELETSLGGVYSRLAVDLQLPIAVWLLAQNDIKIKGTRLIPTVVTGLAALSRSAEAQQLGLFLTALAQVGALPPQVLARLQLSPVISTLAGAYGITSSKYVKSEEQVAQEQQQAQAATNEAVANQAATTEGAKALAQKGTEE